MGNPKAIIVMGSENDMPVMEEAAKALAELGVRKVRHPGNFRYAWALGSSRRAVHLAPARTTYPKAAVDLMTGALTERSVP